MPLTQVPNTMVNFTSTRMSSLRSNSNTGGTNVCTFVMSSGSAAAGDIYTVSGNQYQVITNGYDSVFGFLVCRLVSGVFLPGGTGTLTKVSGSGSSSIPYSAINYDAIEIQSNTKAIRVRMVGGGGGGGGATAGNNGGFTIWQSDYGGTAQIVANGGAGGSIGSGNTAAGGSAASQTNGFIGGYRGFSVAGGRGSVGNGASSGMSGAGGNSVFGGGGGNSISSGLIGQGVANTGGGGGGASNVSTAGGGGGAGAYVEFYITTPLNTISPYYTFTIGAGGTPATNGGTGGSGIIIVEEFCV